MTELVLPPRLAPLVDRLARLAGDGGVEAHIVGGSVRDLLLAREMRDLDLVVDRDALAWARRVADTLGGHFVRLDDVNAVARVALDNDVVSHLDIAQRQGSLEDDLRRRDLTVDALAVPIGGSQVVDVCGGLADLRAGVARMTSPAAFDADPLRLLRAVRVAGELGFRVDEATQAAIRARVHRISDAAAERRRDEVSHICALEQAYPSLRLLDELGLLDALLPELASGRGVSQPGEFHAYDVFEHGMRTVEALDLMLAPEPPSRQPWLWRGLWREFGWCERELRAYLDGALSEGRMRAGLLKLTALLHDVAKPQTRVVEDGKAHFYGHADLGAGIVEDIMRRFRFSAREVEFARLLVAEHLRPVQLAQVGDVPTRRALYRFYRDMGDAVPAVLLLSLADAASARGERMTPADWSRHVAYMNSLLVRSREEEGIVNPPRLLTGHDIMQGLQIPEGPLIGQLLELLREAQAAGEVTSADEALAFVGRLHRSGDSAVGQA